MSDLLKGSCTYADPTFISNTEPLTMSKVKETIELLKKSEEEFQRREFLKKVFMFNSLSPRSRVYGFSCL